MEDNCSHSQNGEIEADWDSGPRYTVYHYRFTIDVLSIGHIIIGTLGVVLFIVEVSLSCKCHENYQNKESSVAEFWLSSGSLLLMTE